MNGWDWARDIQNTAATGHASGGFLVPQWLINGGPPPEEPPRWGKRVEGVRMYEYDGELDEYNDIRWGRNEQGRAIIAVDGDNGYSLVDLADLLEWAKGIEIDEPI